MDLNGGKLFAQRGGPGLRGPTHHDAAAGGPEALPAQFGHLGPAALHRAPPEGPRPGRGPPLATVPGGRRAGQARGGQGAEARGVPPLVQVEVEGVGVALALQRTQAERGLGRGPQAADAQQALEGLPELQVGAGVDDGVDAAVEVAQPEGDLEGGV